jgi:lysophospholipase L1-like esterase
VHYIDITPWTREAALDISLLAPDGLHPSAKEYKRWAEKIADFFKSKI